MGVVFAVVFQPPSTASRWSQQPAADDDVQSRLVPPQPSLYIQAKSAPSGVLSCAKTDSAVVNW